VVGGVLVAVVLLSVGVLVSEVVAVSVGAVDPLPGVPNDVHAASVKAASAAPHDVSRRCVTSRFAGRSNTAGC